MFQLIIQLIKQGISVAQVLTYFFELHITLRCLTILIVLSPSIVVFVWDIIFDTSR